MQNYDRAVFLMVAALWLGLGAVSTRTPVLTGSQWLAVSLVPAGAAIAVARFATRRALAVYVISASLVGLARSVAYLTDGALSPAFVWAIVTVTTALLGYELKQEAER